LCHSHTNLQEIQTSATATAATNHIGAKTNRHIPLHELIQGIQKKLNQNLIKMKIRQIIEFSPTNTHIFSGISHDGFVTLDRN